MNNVAKRALLGKKTRLHVLHICNTHFVRNSCIRQHCRNIEAVIQTNFRQLFQLTVTTYTSYKRSELVRIYVSQRPKCYYNSWNSKMKTLVATASIFYISLILLLLTSKGAGLVFGLTDEFPSDTLYELVPFAKKSKASLFCTKSI